MRMILCTAAVAVIAVPAALAKPPHPTPARDHAATTTTATTTTTTTTTTTAAHAPKVLFVLRGTLGAYSAATTTANGSVTITVTGANHESSLLKGTTLTLPVGTATKIVGTVTSGDRGIVKIRAERNASAATLAAGTAFQVVDQSSGTD